MPSNYPEWEVVQFEPKTTHCYPPGFGHELAGRTCWCQPEVLQICPVCLCKEAAKPGCLSCGGSGLVPAFTDDPEWSTVVNHVDLNRVELN